MLYIFPEFFGNRRGVTGVAIGRDRLRLDLSDGLGGFAGTDQGNVCRLASSDHGNGSQPRISTSLLRPGVVHRQNGSPPA
jgi:hypothetical protein